MDAPVDRLRRLVRRRSELLVELLGGDVGAGGSAGRQQVQVRPGLEERRLDGLGALQVRRNILVEQRLDVSDHGGV